ncbi:hypothetical protein GALMADRAFT_54029 [Galerina marginata CBS 339.88]|uniref:RNase III domain-containing protein n=1 Tax=Galerina marginata (strain CBS 339.88) TaxID=685588 RepID=A0A067TRH3_GALM3|nr:hypothetical protein GALMADRAFT_54029 [Galerina marginata CBS 339.88]
MQRSVVALIHSRDFSFALPPLTQRAWPMLCDDLDRERLEFLGDALIGSAISEILFHCRPNEGPGFYTNARMVLVANSTFAHLMQKVGLFELCGTAKKAGDAFETVLAAFHHEFGPQAFQTYLRKSFSPLIESVGSACDRYQCV